MEELPCLTLDIPTHATPILVGHPIWCHRAPSTSSREAVPAQCGPGWSSLSSPSSWFSGWRSSITAPTRRVTSLAHPPPRDPHLPCRGPKLRQIPGVMHRSRRLPPRPRGRADERSRITAPDAESADSASAFLRKSSRSEDNRRRARPHEITRMPGSPLLKAPRRGPLSLHARQQLELPDQTSPTARRVSRRAREDRYR